MRDNKDFRNYYEIGKSLGEGIWSVFEATKKDTKEKRAIKIMDKNKIKNIFKNKYLEEPNNEFMQPYINCFNKEVENMQKMEGKNQENKNAVKFYEFFDNTDEFAIIMELCDENMIKHLAKKKEAFQIKEVKEIMVQLNKTLKKMNENKIIYGDLKLENILIKYDDKENTKYTVKLKINDGTNTMAQLNKLFNSMAKKYNSNCFVAPELLKSNSNEQNYNYNEQCDLWSIGIIIYVLNFKKYPYRGITEEELLNNIKKAKQKNLLKTGDDDLDDLIRSLLVEDPKKRLTWSQYFNHPFFTKNPKNEYEIGKRIGESGYGFIYEAKHKKTGGKRAIKIFDKNLIREEYLKQYFRNPTEEEMKPFIKDFYNEMHNMKIIEGKNKDNKNAVKLYEYYDTEDEFGIIMELCDNNLFNVLLINKESFDIEIIKDILTQINNSFRIMINNKLVHRELKLENILIKKGDDGKNIYKLKITYNSCLIKNIMSEEVKGNPLYMAPEILKGENYNEKCDLWSLGILLYVLCFKEYPYKGKTSAEILENIKNLGKNNLKKTKDSKLEDLIKKLLEEDPNKRLNWEEYFNHEFFQIRKKTTSAEDIKVKVIYDDFRNFYDNVEYIGKGGYGNVYKAIKKDTQEKRAIKVIDKKGIRNDFMNENFRQISEEEMKIYINKLIDEIKNMKIVEENNNENTVKSYECFDNEDEFCIVMELCDNNLTKIFAARKNPYTLEEIKVLLTQLNNSFKIMHENLLSHRDLKLDNILVKYGNNNKPIWKLTDYGVSKQLASMSKNFSTKTGTLFFMAPEVLKGQKYKEKCDLWSLGIILYVLHFRDYPYRGEKELTIVNQIEKNGQKNFKKSGNDDFDDLIIKLLKADPNERIGWDEYFKHPFLNMAGTTGTVTESYNSDIGKSNEILIKVKVEKSREYKDIYFLENNKKEEIHNKDINESNIEVYINNTKIKYSKCFRPTKEGEYTIKLVFLKQITDCSYIFNNCRNITSIDLSSFDSSKVTHMNYMFSECYNLNEINLNNLNTNNVIDINHMFNKCHELTKIEFPSSFNTQNIIDMSFMFNECQKLSEIIFSKSFITSKVTSMKSIFGKCFKLKNLNISNFNTENVTDMSYMFEQCNNLEKIVLDSSKFKTNKVVNMVRMFSECNSLKEIDLSSFNVENVIHMNYMFNNCRQLTTVDLSKTKINQAANLAHMFDNCSNINTINISNFKLTDGTKIEKMFDNLEKIQKIIVNNNDIIKFKNEFRKFDKKFLSQ